MLSRPIEAIEEEIVSLKDLTDLEIKDIYAYLSQPGATTKLRPRIMEHKGYSTFSIIWQRLIFYDFANRKAKLRAIRKGPSYRVPRSRLFSHCHNCPSWEAEFIWEREEGFARVRRKQSLLSQGLSALKKYGSLEPETTAEQCDYALTPITPGACKGLQDIVKTLAEALESLKKRTCLEVAEVVSHLSENGRTRLRPKVGSGNGASTFMLEWIKSTGSDPRTGKPTARVISRDGRRSIRRSRLLAHCRDCDETEKHYIWEKELGFGRVRRQVDLLGQAITALKQYVKEAD